MGSEGNGSPFSGLCKPPLHPPTRLHHSSTRSSRLLLQHPAPLVPVLSQTGRENYNMATNFLMLQKICANCFPSFLLKHINIIKKCVWWLEFSFSLQFQGKIQIILHNLLRGTYSTKNLWKLEQYFFKNGVWGDASFLWETVAVQVKPEASDGLIITTSAG